MPDDEKPPPSEEERDKFRAEAEKARAEARKLSAEALEAEHKAEMAKLELRAKEHAERKAELARRKELVDDEYHRVYRFVGSVGKQSVDSAIGVLRQWARLDGDLENKPRYEIQLFSPGGEVIHGLALYDFVTSELRGGGFAVDTHAFGMAASMGSVLLQMGDKRYVSPSCSFLIHEVSAGAMGSWGEIQDTVKWLEAMQDRLFDILAERATRTKAWIRTKAKRTDWWMIGPDVVKYGFADDVR